MTLENGKKLTIQLMRKHHIYPMFNFKFGYGKKNIGLCCYEEGNYYISISKHFILSSNKQQLTDVILHEVAHALDFFIRGYSYHDKFWRSVCQQIGCSGDRLIK